MENFPKEIYDLSCPEYRTYVINKGREDEITFKSEALTDDKINASEIIDENNEFVNGFKVVKMKNGEFAYLKEGEKTPLPYRFNIAFDFNEYGLAMVGIDNKVTWINKKFDCFTHGPKNFDGSGISFFMRSYDGFKKGIFGVNNGYYKISSFSKSQNPLSMISIKKEEETNRMIRNVYYIEPSCELKYFYESRGEGYFMDYSSFDEGTPFNELGMATVIMKDCIGGNFGGSLLLKEEMIYLYDNGGFLRVGKVNDLSEKRFMTRNRRK